MEQTVHESATNGALDLNGRWRSASVSLVVAITAILIIFHDAVTTAVSQWISAGAYNHCFLILPIAFYMIWSNRADLKTMEPKPTSWGLVVIVPFGIGWFLAYLSGIAELTQFALIGIVQGVLLAVLGWAVYRKLLFPFWYLWLLVPSGQFLVPPLQHLTANSAGALLDLTAIPTFHDGLVIDVPSGHYVVAPGCSGLNFVLAGLAVSMAFAELTYRSWWRRIGFVVAILAMAVAGNALRVFLIIAVAHITNNVGDIVDDHLLYGWGFFTLLLWGAMALGVRFRQDLGGSAVSKTVAAAVGPRYRLMAALALVVAAVAPAVAWGGWHQSAVAASTRAPILSCGAFQSMADASDWVAPVPQVDTLATAVCQLRGQTVYFAVATLNRPLRQGKLVGLEGWLIDRERWPTNGRTRIEAGVDGHLVPVTAERIGDGDHSRLLWSLRWINGGWYGAGLETALADFKAEMSGHRRASLVLLATAPGDNGESGKALLREFLAGVPLDAILAPAHAGSDE